MPGGLTWIAPPGARHPMRGLPMVPHHTVRLSSWTNAFGPSGFRVRTTPMSLANQLSPYREYHTFPVLKRNPFQDRIGGVSIKFPGGLPHPRAMY